MEKTEVYWLLGIVGTFCGVIIGMVRWYANRMHDSVDKLITVTNNHTTVIAVESNRNDSQDDRLDGHDKELTTLRERVFQVTYRKTP